MRSYNFLLAGFGGQGVLFFGKVIATAGLVDGLEVSWLPSYGPEMRGGTANCSVCISDEPIGAPQVTQPDVLVAMNLPSYDKYIGAVVPGGVAVVDSSLVGKKSERQDIACHYIPSTELAEQNGLGGLSNIVLLGKVLKETGFASLDTVKEAIRRSVPASKQEMFEKNLRALEIGMNA